MKLSSQTTSKENPNEMSKNPTSKASMMKCKMKSKKKRRNKSKEIVIKKVLQLPKKRKTNQVRRKRTKLTRLSRPK